MHILLLSLSLLGITQSTRALTDAELIKIAAAQIILSIGSGVISELLYPSQASTLRNTNATELEGNVYTVMGVGILNFIIGLYTSGHGYRYTSFCILIFSIYLNIGSSIATQYIRNFLLNK